MPVARRFSRCRRIASKIKVPQFHQKGSLFLFEKATNLSKTSTSYFVWKNHKFVKKSPILSRRSITLLKGPILYLKGPQFSSTKDPPSLNIWLWAWYSPYDMPTTWTKVLHNVQWVKFHLLLKEWLILLYLKSSLATVRDVFHN